MKFYLVCTIVRFVQDAKVKVEWSGVEWSGVEWSGVEE